MKDKLEQLEEVESESGSQTWDDDVEESSIRSFFY